MSRSQRTRSRLQDEAIRLFTERGFDGVTVDEVARAAGVSHMTFFRHFPTKESVVLDDPYDPMLAAAVAAQGDVDRHPLERIRQAVLDSWDGLEEPGDETTRARIVLAASHPSLRARIWENNRRTEKVIVEALTGTGVAHLDAAVAAGAVLGAVTAALLDWAEDDGGETLGDRVRRAMDLLAPVGASR